MSSKTNRSVSILLAVVFLCVTSCGRIEIEVEETETEKVTVISEIEETTEAPDPYDITAEELYRAIRNDEIPYDDAVKYPAFRAETKPPFFLWITLIRVSIREK